MYWYFLIPLILVCGYGAYQWYELHTATTVGQRISAAAEPYTQEPAAASGRVLVAGDSTAVGVGAADSAQSIAGYIGTDFPTVAITNIGESGITTATLADQLRAHASSGYDVVLVQIGANDITGGTDVDALRDALTRVLDRAEELGTQVVLMTAGNVGLAPVFHWPLSAVMSHRTRTVRALFMEAAAARAAVTYIDLFRERGNEPFNTDVPRYYAADRFHPSGAGYGLWYAQVRPALPW